MHGIEDAINNRVPLSHERFPMLCQKQILKSIDARQVYAKLMMEFEDLQASWSVRYWQVHH